MLELSKGTQLAERYTLERPLGSGGEAVTWLAKDRFTRASVVLKIVAGSKLASERLRQEWQTNLRLMHPHIVRAFEFHKDQGAAFYSQQYVDGADLGALAAKPLADILPPLGLVADALRYAHGKGIVHRDVKASNVLLDHNGVPYLSDFGVAAEVGAIAGGGSPIASSPQARHGEAAQPSDDVFSLGVLLYELIAGAPPWPAEAEPAPLRSAVGDAMPESVVSLVARMLDKDASKRPTAEETGETLRDAGYAPGPARSQIAARPFIADEPVETVAAVRPGAAAAVAAETSVAPAKAPGLSSRTVLAGLAALVIVLIGVVFLLPSAVDEQGRSAADSGAVPPTTDESGFDSSIAGDVAGAAEDADIDRVTREFAPENQALDGERIEFNENDADYSGLDDDGKLRYNVEMILGELLSSFETLEQRSVQRWAPVPYRRARELYAEGDAAFLKRNWAMAEIHYLDSLSLLEPLFKQVEPEFEKALAGAKAAFEAGDRVEALRLYELAVAITPNHPEARAGLQRAQNLETVLRLVEQGLDYEDELELDAAEASFSQAAALDPNWLPAIEGLERVRATRTKIRFDSRMSEGLEALAMGDYLTARAAFRMAEQLIPGSREPADGLLQVDQGMRLGNINLLEQEAAELQRSEHWDAAATTYEEILKIDGNLSFAQDGLANARRMSALHAQFDEYMTDPDRLSVPSVMERATSLVVKVTVMPDIGPRLAGQRDELSRLLKRAATPVTVDLVSDNMTSVSIYKVGVLGNFGNSQLKLRPGTYVAVGIRQGFRDVRVEFRVAPEIDMQPVEVVCKEPI
ncbi:MAG: protein kinase [Woeseiaceae bacterium]|nr:protein kinase [Woeseiaceae bacterium]